MEDVPRLLVATDFTDRSDRAVQRALVLRAQNPGTNITLIHAIEPGLPAQLAANRQSEAQHFLAESSGIKSNGEAHCQSAVVTGDPFMAIAVEALKRKSGLVVLGEPGKQRSADLFVGTTAERVIRFSDHPTLLVKQETRCPYARVLVAFDGSEGCVRALRTARLIAPDAKFVVVHAWWPPRVATGDKEMADQLLKKENETFRTLVRTVAGPTDLAIDLIEGNPFTILRNDVGSCDLLVMGTHSKTRLATSNSIGSLAKHLLAEVSCDVLVSQP